MSPIDPSTGYGLTPDARTAERLADLDRRLRQLERGRGPRGAVTALPSAPYDGQIIRYLADAAAGVEWTLRYRLTNPDGTPNASAYKWDFQGGAPISNFLNGQNTAARTVSTYAPMSAATVPLAGDYFAWGRAGAGTTAGNDTLLAITRSASRNLDHRFWRQANGSGVLDYGAGQARLTGMAAGEDVEVSLYTVAVGAGSSCDYPEIAAIPIRVG